MDTTDPELERSVEPLRHHLREPTASSGPRLILQVSFPLTLTQKTLRALGAAQQMRLIDAALITRVVVATWTAPDLRDIA